MQSRNQSATCIAFRNTVSSTISLFTVTTRFMSTPWYIKYIIPVNSRASSVVCPNHGYAHCNTTWSCRDLLSGMDNHYVLAETQFYPVRYVGYICIDPLYECTLYPTKHARNFAMFGFVLIILPIDKWELPWYQLRRQWGHYAFRYDNHRYRKCRQSWHHDNFQFSIYVVNVIYLPISYRTASLALGQRNGCVSSSKATLNGMG